MAVAIAGLLVGVVLGVRGTSFIGVDVVSLNGAAGVFWEVSGISRAATVFRGSSSRSMLLMAFRAASRVPMPITPATPRNCLRHIREGLAETIVVDG